MNADTLRRHVVRATVLGTITLGACADPHGTSLEHPFADLGAASLTEYSRIGDGHVDFACESLCAHAAWGTYGAGVFTVDRLVEVEEPNGSGGADPFIYIVLDVVDAWYPDDLPSQVVARHARLGTGGFDLELGDRVAAFLRGDGEGFNAGFPRLAPNRWYEPAVGNNWRVIGSGCADVVYDTPTLRTAARLASDSFAPGEFPAERSCIDIDFDRCPTESLIPPGWLPYDILCPED